MNEELSCITNEGKMTKNEWGKKLEQFFFYTLLAKLFKQRSISFVTSYKYLNKLMSEA